MTNEEKIKALKENTSAFGLMDKELQDKARDIGKKEFRFLERGLSGWYTCARDSVFGIENIFRLRHDYAEEPEVIELEIKKNAYGELVVIFDGNNRTYTMCPALCPMKGYRFKHYKYDDCNSLKQVKHSRNETVFPTHAVYKKVESKNE